MDEDPDYFGIRKLIQPRSKDRAKLSVPLWAGWAGRRCTEQEYGHPRLRAPAYLCHRHAGARPMAGLQYGARNARSGCPEPDLRARLEASFFNTADWMRNTAD